MHQLIVLNSSQVICLCLVTKHINTDTIFEALGNWERNENVTGYLAIILPVCRKLLRDQLPGGR